MKDQRTGLDPAIPGDHVKMMNAPDLWPHGAFLPLTRPRPAHTADEPEDLCLSRTSELGMLIVGGDVPRFTVWRINMLDGRILALALTGERPEGVEFYDYADAEGVFDAGWRVD
jgi:hypothetical protein